MKKHFLNATLLAFLSLALCMTGCNDDDGYPDVDGQDPTMALATDHIQSGVGRRFTIEGKLADADGIASIRLQCADLFLDKTIDLIEIYGAPKTEYDLSYYYDLKRDEIGERFIVKVTVIDVGGREVSQEVLITMDGDFEKPVFKMAPDDMIAVLLKNGVEPKFTLNLSMTDDRGLDYLTIDIGELAGFEQLRVDAEGKTAFEYSKEFVMPNEKKDYPITITLVDKTAKSVECKSIISVTDIIDFEKMYLADVATAAELNSDVFGVPMRIDHVGKYQYRAKYYCQKAGTEIYFIPQKTDFAPVCFGLNPEDEKELINDPQAKPIVLTEANVYYEITFDILYKTYKVRTYSIAEAIDPIPHKFGSISLDTWGDGGSWLQEFYFGYMTGNPREIQRFTQDATNPHLYTLDTALFLEAGTTMNFVIHNWHHDGWWNYCTWRADDSANPEIMGYYGNVVNPEWREKVESKNWVGDNWVKPAVNVTGDYKLIFDAHLGRAKVIPAN